jgi:RNA polymerase sigma-70 factor (ECF subfamily)
MDSARANVEVAAPGPAPGFEPLEFAAVYEQTFAFVWRSVRRLGVADAARDDVCQEVFVVVHRQLAEFRGDSSLKTWVFGILRHVVRAQRRTLQRKDPAARTTAPLLDAELLAAGERHDPHETAVRSEDLKVARELFDALPEDKRVVLMLADLEDIPVPEIAALLEINVNTAYARLRAARHSLAEVVRRHHARAVAARGDHV